MSPRKQEMLLLSMVVLLTFPGVAGAEGRIILANDDWTLSDGFGFGYPNDAQAFALNVASWFTDGAAGNFLVYSESFGLTGTQLAAAMTSAGHAWTVSTSSAFDLPTLQHFDALFLGGRVAGQYPDSDTLIEYVTSGGDVYLMGGTGDGGVAAEAAGWNGFLSAFGLAFDVLGTNDGYNHLIGSIPITSSNPLFLGVDYLYQDNGQVIHDILPADPRGEIILSAEGWPLYAAYLPEPATGLLLLPVICFALCRRRAQT